MVAPAFGFSVGDFLAAGALIVKICKSLKVVGGAASEYQQLIIELEGLQRSLHDLQALEPNEFNINRVNALRGMALSVRIPLQDFLDKLQKYETSMGVSAPTKPLHGASKKAKWAVAVTEEVNKFRAIIVAKIVSINLLIGIQTSETVTGISKVQKEQHSHLRARMTELRESILEAQAQITTRDEESKRFRVDTQSSLHDIRTEVSDLKSDTSDRLDRISANTSSMAMSLISMQDLGKEIIRFLSSFPVEMRDLLRKVHLMNMQMYYILLHQPTAMPRSPNEFPDARIELVDCLGRNFELPYEWFCRWELFEGLLRNEFSGQPGERKVIEEEYELYNISGHPQLVRKEDWSNSIHPGSKISMAMIISKLQWRIGTCPRPSCQQPIDVEGDTLCICPHCGLHFLSSALDRDQIDEGSMVSQKQGEEDHHLFGIREIPMDTHGIMNSLILLPGDSLDILEDDDQNSIIEPTAGPPDTLLFEQKGTNYFSRLRNKVKDKVKPIFGHDDSDGPRKITPLYSWLSRLEPPDVTPPVCENADQKMPNKRTQTEDVQLLEAFRNISIKAHPIPKSEVPRICNTSNKEVDGAEDLPFAARIYYRNILDRYPNISRLLARRFAQANLRRAERLGISGDQIQEYTEANPAIPHSIPNDSYRRVETIVQTIPTVSDSFELLGSESTGAIDNQLDELRDRFRLALSRYAPRRRNSKISKPVTERPTLDPLQQLPSFWTGTVRRPGPNSSASRSSSRNSSMQSGDAPGYKPPSISIASTRSSIERPLPNMILPPPPVELGSQKSFVCDICQQTVHILGAKEWRKHVLYDLQPYVCSFESCKETGKVYSTRRAWFKHELKRHRNSTKYHCQSKQSGFIKCRKNFESVATFRKHLKEAHNWSKWQVQEVSMKDIKKTTRSEHFSYCIFCDTHLEDTTSVPSHVGRHLEEIAFVILAKQYQEWEFYDEESTGTALSSHSSKHERDIRKAILAGDVDTVVRFQEHGYDIMSFKDVIDQSWRQACSKGNHMFVWYLLRNGGRAPKDCIEWAAGARDMKMVTLLLKANVEIDSRFLFSAIAEGKYDMAEFVLKASQELGLVLLCLDDIHSLLLEHPDAANRLSNLLPVTEVDMIEHYTDSFYRAISNKNYMLIKHFLELSQSTWPDRLVRALEIVLKSQIHREHAGCTVFAPPQPDSSTELIAHALVDHTSRILSTMEQSTTLMHIAAFDGHDAAVHYLLHSGFDPNEPDRNHRYPLHKAILGGHKEIAEILLASGAELEIGSGREETVFEYAKARGGWAAQMVDDFNRFGPNSDYSHSSMCSGCNN